MPVYPDRVIDPQLLRSDPDRVRRAQARRGLSDQVVDRALDADTSRRQAIADFERLRAEQKQLGRQIPQAQGDERVALLARTKELSAEVKVAETTQGAAEETWRAALLSIPNVADEAPAGGEDDFVVLEHVGEPRDFAAEGFEPRDHVELGRMLGAIDLERGTKVSGSRFYYLVGVGADLEFALMNLAMEQARAAGFTTVVPPALVKPRAMDGTGYLGQSAGEDVYRIEGEDLYLVGTSEVPLAAYHSDEILEAASLPRRYAAFSPCYRKEAGSYGKDTRGIIRVHWFDKVEMFTFTTVEESDAEHQRLLAWEKEFLDKLELSYRVIDVAAGDLGLSARRKYDCEAWIPTQGKYRELTSTSNCTDFQARRLDIRSRGERGTSAVATLNGTLCAMTRTIVAILETHQQADGSVRVPKALQPHLQGRAVLHPVVTGG